MISGLLSSVDFKGSRREGPGEHAKLRLGNRNPSLYDVREKSDVFCKNSQVVIDLSRNVLVGCLMWNKVAFVFLPD